MPLTDEHIKAMYAAKHGHLKGWLGIEGSYFISGVQAADTRHQTALLQAQQATTAAEAVGDVLLADCRRQCEKQLAAAQEPNLFWNDADPEVGHTSIHDVLDREWNQDSIGINDTLVIQRAVSLPKITVRIIADPTDPDGFDYEVVEPEPKPTTLLDPCCPDEKRNMSGGCTSCGDPCL